MKGLEIKEKLVKSGYKLSDIAQKMNISPQSLHKFLLTEDIKTGVLERIAFAINKDISFFWGEKENRNDEIRIVNEILNKERLLYSLYQKIMDVAILNKDFLKISKTYDLLNSAEIMNNYFFPIPTMTDREKQSFNVNKLKRWNEPDFDKKQYNDQLNESVKILHDIFFDQFDLLYKKITKR